MNVVYVSNIGVKIELACPENKCLVGRNMKTVKVGRMQTLFFFLYFNTINNPKICEFNKVLFIVGIHYA